MTTTRSLSKSLGEFLLLSSSSKVLSFGCAQQTTTRQSMTIRRSFAVSLLLLLLLLLLFLRDGECAAPRVTFSKAKSCCASIHKSVERIKKKAKGRKLRQNQTTTRTSIHSSSGSAHSR